MLRPRPIGPKTVDPPPSDLRDERRAAQVNSHPNRVDRNDGRERAEDSDDTDAESEETNQNGPDAATYRKRTRQEYVNTWYEDIKETEL